MKSFINSIIIGVAIIATACILGKAWNQRFKRNETISVTGWAKKDFLADLIVWRGSFSKKSMSMQEAYAALKKDAENVKQYLLSKGVQEKEIVFSSVDINKEYDYSYGKEGIENRTFAGYNLTQSIQIESAEVDKIENVSREITELINTGIELYSASPQYYYTKLAELKVEMLADAAKDGRLRAEKIAENTKSVIGKLVYSNMGVFQITGQNSDEEYSWGGAYNTSSKRKTASITARLEFTID